MLWNQISPEQANLIEVVFTDIDDTLTTRGKILRESFDALWDLYDAGIKVVPITGRCAGWVDHIARMWPVDGVVGENGAFYAYMDKSERPVKLKKQYFLEPSEVKEAQKKFELIKKEIFERFPTCKVASDQPYREFDLAIDYCEDVPPLNQKQVKEIVEIYEKYGANTKVSSIHVNGWFGDYDKLTMTKIFANEVLNLNLPELEKQAMFCGDSPNDQPMFKFFSNSIGVSNIKQFLDQLHTPPNYMVRKEGGRGFAQIVKILLDKRT